MSKSKYVDNVSAINVIAGIFNNPTLIDCDKYKFYEELFTEDIHRILFNSIYNLYSLGSTKIEAIDIENYLESRPKKLSIYKTYKGAELLLKYKEDFKENTFDYYYNKLTKICLLREYDKIGLDLKDIYDIDNIFDIKKKEKQEEWLDNSSLADIAKVIEDKIEEVNIKYAECLDTDLEDMGDGIFEMLEELKESPDIGYPMFGPYMNTITRGMRPGKVYLWSAPSNVGKTRRMIGDACYCGCSQMYDNKTNKWISTGASIPSILITTEQDIKEVQLMCLAFLSGVNENHIALNEYFVGEEERVIKAAQLIKNGKLKFKEMPDFTINTLENVIKGGIRKYGAELVFFDYIHTSIGILSEITKQSGGVKLREDQVLVLLSTKLKEIATSYGVFIESSTQLNGDWKTTEVLDMNCLRGAKGIADKIDIGGIMVEVTNEDLEKIQPIIVKNDFVKPNIKISIYKNRANEHKNEYLFMYADKGICRYEGLFMTDFNYKLLEVPDIKISVREESVF